MPKSHWLRRAGLLATCLGATAVVGVAPAAAKSKVPGINIYGMGSSLQGVAQIDSGVSGTASDGGSCPVSGWQGWVADWRCTAANQSGLSNPGVSATYTVKSSGQGLAEFGDAASTSCTSTAGALNLDCDPTADGQTTPELDAFIGTDDPPNSTDLSNGEAAGGTGQITVPILQAPIAMILSLPVGIQVGTDGKLQLTAASIAELWGSANDGTETWCTLLSQAGLTKITSGTPTATEYLDKTNACNATITLQARSSGSGTTYSFRGYLYEIDQDLGLSDYPYTLVTDGPSDWPVTVNETGNTSGGNLVADTTATPGSAGYANLADAALASPAYTDEVTTAKTGGKHQIAYALVQNNLNDGSAPNFASPSNSKGTVNVYTGTDISINPSTCTPPSTTLAVGCWVVPSSAEGPWSSTSSTTPGTIPSDPDVYDHGATSTGKPSNTYPIVAVSYDVAWQNYSAAPLTDEYDDSSCGTTGETCATDAGNSTVSYMKYLTGTGQTNLASGGVYYGKLPSSIQTKAKAFAADITP
jgi:ABC-type phosphate transport system substrate-binding protein